MEFGHFTSTIQSHGHNHRKTVHIGPSVFYEVSLQLVSSEKLSIQLFDGIEVSSTTEDIGSAPIECWCGFFDAVCHSDSEQTIG